MSDANSDSSEELQRKRAWFEGYMDRIVNAAQPEPALVNPATRKGVYRCPCCGYPTLDERGGYEICCLCNWEDDGQDDPHAAEIWGGPNRDYSLAEARRNFGQHGIMYRPGGDIRLCGPDTEVERRAKREIAAAFDAMSETRTTHAAWESLWRSVEDGQKTLHLELAQKAAAYQEARRRADLV